MATPTPANKAPAQAVATPPVSTPFSASHNHLAFSPHGPKSVQPSPQHMKKSPANSSTLYGYPNAAGNHPTGSSFGGGYDSPSAAMALGAVGVGGLGDLGIEGIGTPSASGLAGIGLAALSTGGAKGDEQDRSRRLEAVKNILDASKGRLSKAGLERLGKKMEVDIMWEDKPPMLILAISLFSIDIKIEDNVVLGVALNYVGVPESVSKHADKASKILTQDLTVSKNESPLTKTLDRFAINLEKIAVLDRMSVAGLNCYEAIAGIYDSLERLHNWEVEKKGGNGASNKELVVREVMCSGSGRPLMHARERFGLLLDYWEEKRRVSSTAGAETDLKTWSLLVECAPIPALGLFPPLRVSHDWISKDVVKANPPADEVFLAPEGEPVLDWLEPENTMLPVVDAPKVEPIDGVEPPAQKFPEVMFVAKFNPPVVVPYSLAVSIYNSTNAPIDPYTMNTFDGLMFPLSVGERVDQGEARTIKQDVVVPVFDKSGEKSSKIHSNSLMIDKIDYGWTLTEIPFSHPNQLIGMLPVLRQYAFLSTVLGKSFGPTANTAPAVANDSDSTGKVPSFDDFLSGSESSTLKSTTSGTFYLDVSLSTQPNPRLAVVFPFRGRTANVTFEIQLNGLVEVVSQNIISDEHSEQTRTGDDGSKDKSKSLAPKDLARMLEITEDLGIWAEFVTRRFT